MSGSQCTGHLTREEVLTGLAFLARWNEKKKWHVFTLAEAERCFPWVWGALQILMRKWWPAREGFWLFGTHWICNSLLFRGAPWPPVTVRYRNSADSHGHEKSTRTDAAPKSLFSLLGGGSSIVLAPCLNYGLSPFQVICSWGKLLVQDVFVKQYKEDCFFFPLERLERDTLKTSPGCIQKHCSCRKLWGKLIKIF